MKMVILLILLAAKLSVFAEDRSKNIHNTKREAPYATPMDSTLIFPKQSPVAKPVDSTQPKKALLWILPMVVQNADSISREEKRVVEAAIRLGSSQNGEYRVVSTEETARYLTSENEYSQDCFSETCLHVFARKFGKGRILAAKYSREDTLVELQLVLLDGTLGIVNSAQHTRGPASADSLVSFARKSAECFLTKGKCSNLPIAPGEGEKINWLTHRDSVDNRHRFGWAGSGLLVAATGLALVEGQLFQRDDRRNAPTGVILSDEGARSFLRGFFTTPTLGAQYAAMGGAGIAHVNNGLALLMNPAGLGQMQAENAVAAKRTLPGGTPSLFLAWAGPVLGKWSQGLGALYEGDALASETTLQGALAFDFSEFGKTWEGLTGGAELKLYLAEVGRSGTGQDRSTGHSVGAGLDIGLQARISEKITAAFSIKDVLSILRHSNTLTNQAQGEVLPPEYCLGTAYHASSTLLLLMDGQKGLYADQADHVRIGAEQVLFRCLSLRGGMHQIFGREAIRKMSVGFGLNTLPFTKGATKSPLALNYSYEFALNEDEPLGGGQQFSLEMGF